MNSKFIVLAKSQLREIEDYLQEHYNLDSLDIVELEMEIDKVTGRK